VVSSTSVFQYKNRCVDARDIGRDLDVHLILEGSLRSDAGRFRCDTQLVSTATESIAGPGRSTAASWIASRWKISSPMSSPGVCTPLQ